jgi:hypothetical protein
MNSAKVNISLSFEQILNIISQLPSVEKIKLRHYLTKETDESISVLKDVKEAYQEAKKHEEGDIELKTLDQLLDEL